MNSTNIIYEVGEYGPILLLVLSCLLLWKHKTWFKYYCIGIVANTMLNILLKAILLQPRPSVDIHQFELLKKHANDYFFQNGVPFQMLGMPSGHVQSSFFSTIFIYLSLRENKWLFVYLLSSLITCFQRVTFNFHTIYQVVVGSLVGSSFAFFMYSIAREKIKGPIRPKADDGAIH